MDEATQTPLNISTKWNHLPCELRQRVLHEVVKDVVACGPGKETTNELQALTAVNYALGQELQRPLALAICEL